MRTAAALVALLAVVSSPVPQPRHTAVLNNHFAPGDDRYQYVAFEVSPDAESLTISYSYTGDDGSSVLDLGLFEPGPLTPGTPAFRGYSGGAQRSITVGRRGASSGYKAGPLPSGTWHVMLGLYKVAPTGVDVRLIVTESREEAAQSRTDSAARATPPAASTSPGWYSGGLHLHTTHSDGSIGPAAVAEAARAAGLDFIVITDHNNTTHTRETMPAAPLHIVGEEVTTPGGHASVWGLPEGAWIDFRVSPKDPGAAGAINELVAQAHRAGGLFSINHPFGECGACSWEQAIPTSLDGLEIWNGEKGPQDRAIAVWDRLLREGRRVTAVGASDWHRMPSPIGAAAVRVFASQLTGPAILEGIRQHRVIVMRDALTPPPAVRARCGAQDAGVGDSLTCAAGEELAVRVSMPNLPDASADFIWNAARMTSKRIGRGTTFTMPAATGYLRVHVYAADGRTVAITNPVYVATR